MALYDSKVMGINTSTYNVVFPRVSSIEFENDTESIEKDAEKQLEVTIIPSGTTQLEVKYTTSDEATVTIDNGGKIKGIKAGSATITATSIYNSNVKGTCTVTVTDDSNEDNNSNEA